MITENIMRIVRIVGAKFAKHLGKLFVVSSDELAFAEVGNQITSPESQEERVGTLTPVLVKDLSELEDVFLANAVKEIGANLVGAVFNAEEGVPTFLMMHASDESLFTEAGLFAHKVDKLNRDALKVMMENVAANDPDVLQSFVAKSGLMLATPASRGGRKSAAERAQELERYSGNFLSNMQIIRNPDDHSDDDLKQARHEVKMVLSNLSHATLSEFMFTVLLSGLIPEDNVIEERFLNLESAARKSSVYLHITHAAKGETNKNSDGKYRLSFSVGENAASGEKDIRPLSFPGKVETAIFYTVVLYRKNSDQKIIEILSLEKEFCGVYRALYRTDYAEAYEAFDGIKDLREDGQLIYQGRYRNYIPNIRNAVNAALAGIENPAIYHYDYHYRKGGHFYVDKDHITLSEDFIYAAKALQDPEFEVTKLPRGV